MFIFMTYNQALMWSRFERLFAIVMALAIVCFFESMGSAPTWIVTSIALIASQFLAIKCWIDMIRMSRPDKNCWEFKE